MNNTSIRRIIAAAVSASALLIFSGYVSENSGSAAVSECVAECSSRKMLVPCGTPFGIKMLTDGVIVTDFGCVKGSTSQISPAEKAGLRKGDIITAVNGVCIDSNSTLVEAVQLCPDKCRLDVMRDGAEISFTASAVLSEDSSSYRLGMWTKDSCAGIGTMTYYDPETGKFGGLGHGVNDVSSGTRLPLLSGEIADVTITDVIKGGKGAPGELCGSFVSYSDTGKIYVNSDFGVFGTCFNTPVTNEPIEVAEIDEIETGKAVIYTTTGGMTPEEYEIEIVSVDTSDISSVRNMTIRVTDEKLISKTGGIVQGMSGSPIIQNGRLVGAVTHVLVNDSKMGYAVFAENMINASEF